MKQHFPFCFELINNIDFICVSATVDCSGGGEALNQAAAGGKVTEVQGLIACPGVDINYADGYGQTGLWKAAFEGHLEVVKLLLNTPGIEPNKARTEDGMTPLFMAAWHGDHAVVRELLSNPLIDPNQARTDEEQKGITPLWQAAWKDHEEVVRELLSHPQTDPNQARTTDGVTPLIIASNGGHDVIVRELLRKGADPNQAKTDTGSTPLFVASQKGHVDVVRELLMDKRVNINQSRTDIKFTPFMVASSNGQLGVVKLFLRCSETDVSYVGDGNRNALSVAKQFGHKDVVEAIESRSSYLSKLTPSCNKYATNFARQNQVLQVVKGFGSFFCIAAAVLIRNLYQGNRKSL